MDQVGTILVKNWKDGPFGPLKWPLGDFLFCGSKCILIPTKSILAKMLQVNPVENYMGVRLIEEVYGQWRIISMFAKD